MSRGKADWIEAAVDCCAAAIFATAVAFATLVVGQSLASGPQPAALAAAAGLAAFIGCSTLLRNVRAEVKSFAIGSFDIVPFDFPPAPDELVLSKSDRLRDDELVLDDILTELGPDSRVVRLFDPAAMPSPGELRDRIDHHLRQRPGTSAAPDESEALFEALAELRRSLR
jgi:hypothetical protein